MKSLNIAAIEELDTRSMSIHSPHGYEHITVGTHVQDAILSRAHVLSRHISARARIGSRSGERVGFHAASTALKRSFNGDARRSSADLLLEGLQPPRIYE